MKKQQSIIARQDAVINNLKIDVETMSIAMVSLQQQIQNFNDCMNAIGNAA